MIVSQVDKEMIPLREAQEMTLLMEVSDLTTCMEEMGMISCLAVLGMTPFLEVLGTTLFLEVLEPTPNARAGVNSQGQIGACEVDVLYHSAASNSTVRYVIAENGANFYRGGGASDYAQIMNWQEGDKITVAKGTGAQNVGSDTELLNLADGDLIAKVMHHHLTPAEVFYI